MTQQVDDMEITFHDADNDTWKPFLEMCDQQEKTHGMPCMVHFSDIENAVDDDNAILPFILTLLDCGYIIQTSLDTDDEPCILFSRSIDMMRIGVQDELCRRVALVQSTPVGSA